MSSSVFLRALLLKDSDVRSTICISLVYRKVNFFSNCSDYLLSGKGFGIARNHSAVLFCVSSCVCSKYSLRMKNPMVSFSK